MHAGDEVRFPETNEHAYLLNDSFQFQLLQDMTEDNVQPFLDQAATHGLPIELFGHKTNARNGVNWGFTSATDPLPQTSKMINWTANFRVPLMWETPT